MLPQDILPIQQRATETTKSTMDQRKFRFYFFPQPWNPPIVRKPADSSPWTVPACAPGWQCATRPATDFYHDVIPNEIVSHILSFMTPGSLTSLANVNHYFEEMVESALKRWVFQPEISLAGWYTVDELFFMYDAENNMKESHAGLDCGKPTLVEKAGFLILCIKLFERREHARVAKGIRGESATWSYRRLETLKIDRCVISVTTLLLKLHQSPHVRYPTEGGHQYEDRCEYNQKRLKSDELGINPFYRGWRDPRETYTENEQGEQLWGSYVYDGDPLPVKNTGLKLSDHLIEGYLKPHHQIMAVDLKFEDLNHPGWEGKFMGYCSEDKRLRELHLGEIVHLNYSLEDMQWKRNEEMVPSRQVLTRRLNQAGLPAI